MKQQWIICLTLIFLGYATSNKRFNISDPCNRPLSSTFSSDVTKEIVTDCNNGTIAWHVPRRYLETTFFPSHFMEGHSVCFESVSSDNIEIIQNIDGILTWLPIPKEGKESCTVPERGVITVAFKGPRIPKAFAVFVPFRIIRANIS